MTRCCALTLDGNVDETLDGFAWAKRACGADGDHKPPGQDVAGAPVKVGVKGGKFFVGSTALHALAMWSGPAMLSMGAEPTRRPTDGARDWRTVSSRQKKSRWSARSAARTNDLDFSDGRRRLTPGEHGGRTSFSKAAPSADGSIGDASVYWVGVAVRQRSQAGPLTYRLTASRG